jgi:hypothetical protein
MAKSRDIPATPRGSAVTPIAVALPDESTILRRSKGAVEVPRALDTNTLKVYRLIGVQTTVQALRKTAAMDDAALGAVLAGLVERGLVVTEGATPVDQVDLDFTSPEVLKALRAEAEQVKHAEEAARQRVDAERSAKLQAEARVRTEAEAKARADADAKVNAAALARLRAEKVARTQTESEISARQDALERAETEARSRADALAKAEAEARARTESVRQAETDAARRLAAVRRMEAQLKGKMAAMARLDAARQQKASVQTEAREEALALAENERQKRAEAESRAEAERLAREQVEARVESERRAREQVEAQVESERRAREQVEAQVESERRAREAATEQARTEALALVENERRAREQIEAQIESERRAREQVEAQVESERRAREQVEAQVESERRAREAATEQARTEALALVENERRAREQIEAQVESERSAREAATEQARTEALALVESERRAREAAAEQARAETLVLVESERRAREAAEAERQAREKAQALAESERLLREAAEAQMRALSSAQREAEDRDAARVRSESDARAAREAIESSERKSRVEPERFSLELDTPLTLVSEEQPVEPARSIASDRTPKAARSPEATLQAASEAKARQQAEALARQQMADAELEARRAGEEAQQRLLAEEETSRRAREAAEIARRARAEREKFEREREREHQRKLAEAQARALAHDSTRADQPRPSHWKRYVGGVVLLGTIVGLLEIVPVNFYLNRVEKVLSDALGQPVAVKTMHASLIPRPNLRLSGVTIGSSANGAAIAMVHAVPTASFLSSGLKGPISFTSVRLDTVTVTQDFIPRLPDVVGMGGKQTLGLQQISIRNLRLDTPGLELPPADIELFWNGNGSFSRASILTYGGRVKIDLTQADGKLAFNMAATGWQPIPGSKATIDQLKVEGSATREGLSATRVDASLYGGQAQGSLTIGWGSKAASTSASGEFTLTRLDVAALLPVMAAGATASGMMDGSTKFSMRAPTLRKLLDAPQVSTAFAISRGWLGGIDVARLLRDPTQPGGRTLFDEWTGVYDVAAASHSLRQMRLTSGPMIATGAVNVGADGRLSGRISAELPAGNNTTVRSSFNVGGTIGNIEVAN